LGLVGSSLRLIKSHGNRSRPSERDRKFRCWNGQFLVLHSEASAEMLLSPESYTETLKEYWTTKLTGEEFARQTIVK
jgi:hypothetical protein